MTPNQSDIERALALVPKLEGLLEKATCPPWQLMAPDEVDVFVPIIAVHLGEDGQPLHTPTRGLVGGANLYPTEVDAEDYTRAIANAALIVQAVNDLPTLLSALRTVGDERERIRGTAREMLATALDEAGAGYEASAIRAGATRDAMDRAALVAIERATCKENMQVDGWRDRLKPYGDVGPHDENGLTADAAPGQFAKSAKSPSAPVSSLPDGEKVG